MLVKFEQGKTGPMARINKKISFPNRQSVRPQSGSLWEVDIAGQNAKGTINFLELKYEYLSVAEDPSIWGLPKREVYSYYSKGQQVHIEYALTHTEKNELERKVQKARLEREKEANLLKRRVQEIAKAKIQGEENLKQMLLPIATELDKHIDTVVYWVERAIDMNDIPKEKVAIKIWCQKRWNK